MPASSVPPFEDYYALLGIDVGAGGAEVRRAWRELALRYHPDRAGDAATGTFQRLSVAYAVLSDPLARAAYDRRRRRAAEPWGAGPSGAPTRNRAPRSAPATSPTASPSSGSPPRGASRPTPAVMLSRLCGSLSTLIACGAARLDDEGVGDGFITLVLREAEAAQGGMATISMWVSVWCPHCATVGTRERSAPARSAGCACCGGRGTVDELFSAWLAVPPGVTTSEVLIPSAELSGMVEPVRFRVRLRETAS